MKDKILGPGRSPLRVVSLFLALVITLLGLALGFVESWRSGLPIVLVGLAAGLVLARMADTREQKAEVREQLGRITGPIDEGVLTRMVEQARTVEHGHLPVGEHVRADIDDDDLRTR